MGVAPLVVACRLNLKRVSVKPRRCRRPAASLNSRSTIYAGQALPDVAPWPYRTLTTRAHTRIEGDPWFGTERSTCYASDRAPEECALPSPPRRMARSE